MNLFLHVTGRRADGDADGYHELESLFVFTETGDRITLEKSDRAALVLEGEFAADLKAAGGAGEGNLVFQALYMLAEKTGCSADVKITLQKNLPIASGIGGGSADAAATLLGLLALWGHAMPAEALQAVALGLGADVPACLHTTPLYVRGIGENFTAAKLPKAYGVLLVNPGASVSTPAIFGAYAKRPDGVFDAPIGENLALPTDHEGFLQYLSAETHNALQRPAEAECAVVKDVLAALDDLGAALYTCMSGSGATCFALFEDGKVAEKASATVKNLHPEWWVWADTLKA
ncbi:MAG: 4-(cytidine 5'-diphospho)-2-C-methyl-D-erythritol kinase [Kordiimonadaceae bacterium]|nr:4-(cytidine 5'-diphospho)-2-C-methyl-D-erythritol kinase [Kordiimonadaceae bacterium]